MVIFNSYVSHYQRVSSPFSRRKKRPILRIDIKASELVVDALTTLCVLGHGGTAGVTWELQSRHEGIYYILLYYMII
jgi:hypothetical protein